MKKNGQDGSDGRAEHHDGHDGPDVLGHERNGALGDVGATKDEVDDTGVMILWLEVLLADVTAKGGDQRRNDASGGDAAMKLVPKCRSRCRRSFESGTEQEGASSVSSLVDRAAHIKGAHAADGQAKDHRPELPRLCRKSIMPWLMAAMGPEIPSMTRPTMAVEHSGYRKNCLQAIKARGNLEKPYSSSRMT